jgi:FkbM family methyltransferase
MNCRQMLQVLREQKRPARFLISRALMRTGTSRFLSIRMEGLTIPFQPTALSAALWIDASERHADEEFLRRYLKPGDAVIDVGANIGHLALTASARVGAQGVVYAIEPHPRTFKYLMANVELNRAQNVKALNTAVGHTIGQVLFSDSRSDDQNSVVVNRPGIEVPITRLDDLAIAEDLIALLKVDVEGFEKPVLEGASAVLARTLAVYIESWDTHFARFGYVSGDLFRLLRSSGFELFRFVSESRIARLAVTHASQHCENLLGLRNCDDFLLRTGFEIGS